MDNGRRLSITVVSKGGHSTACREHNMMAVCVMTAQQTPLETNPTNTGTDAVSPWESLPTKSQCPAVAAHTPWGDGQHNTNTTQVLRVSPRRVRHSSQQLSLPDPILSTFTKALILALVWPWAPHLPSPPWCTELQQGHCCT